MATSVAEPKRRVIFSGIQPTGVPHLGNYLGALANWVQLQRNALPEDELLFSIVGWHALILPQSPKQLSEARTDILAVLLAICIDPRRSIIFHQEHNPNHTELAWIFNCITPMRKLRRMTTWKSRLAASKNQGDDAEMDETELNVGFSHILATHVPVGDDQTQHLELSRVIADQFNRNFKAKRQLFPPSKGILSLRDPTSKMSKSAPDTSSRILFTNSSSQITSKIRSAVTDSISGITYDPVNRPGTANLLSILAACKDENVNKTVSGYAGKNHGALKADVTKAVEEKLKGPRKEYEKLKMDKEYLRRVAQEGAERARVKSEATMMEVRERIGLL
ncbi:hypothetical protein BDP27DRAFT_1384316 [Rhodocollybia butyracea]|uniref:tryptophan--tRNA ligase n=1 Tax=Rhodocollybia butyracea TaxID=206335 RepID=A0A9P5U5A5_9AGAR|nr:hypothetical protein BDP27DRAFT_1384316 [Rhodocollybia butyracea]